jgi:hypothetical protein
MTVPRIQRPSSGLPAALEGTIALARLLARLRYGLLLRLQESAAFWASSLACRTSCQWQGKAVAEGIAHEIRTAMGGQLFVDVGAMGFHRFGTDAQFFRHCLCGETTHDKVKDFALAKGKLR